MKIKRTNTLTRTRRSLRMPQRTRLFTEYTRCARERERVRERESERGEGFDRQMSVEGIC